MAKKVNSSEGAVEAIRNLDTGVVEPAKSGEPNAAREKSSSERLFPEFITEDGGIANRPVRPYEDKDKSLPASATPAATNPAPKPEAQQVQTQSNPTPTAPAYLKPEEMAGKMVRIKVDGVEQDVPVETLRDNFQLKRHLDAQLKSLADERRRMELERKAPEPEPQKQTKKEPKSPEVEALEAQIAAMNNQMATLMESLKPQIQDAGVKRLDQRVKETFGESDYAQYHDKIKEWALNEAAKYPGDANAQRFYDSSDTYFAKYQEMKLADLIGKSKTPVNPSAPVLQAQNGAPIVMNNQGQPVSIPNIEPSGGASGGINPNGDWQSRSQDAFNRARQIGTTEAWMDYYRVKTESRQ